MSRPISPLSIELEHILSTLGENIKLARLRRKLSTTLLAERAGMTRNTLHKIEAGDRSVTMGAYANILFCLNLEQDLLLICKDDPLGRTLQDANLNHTRERVAKKKKHD